MLIGVKNEIFRIWRYGVFKVRKEMVKLFDLRKWNNEREIVLILRRKG